MPTIIFLTCKSDDGLLVMMSKGPHFDFEWLRWESELTFILTLRSFELTTNKDELMK
jgi:hypothetical protein